jgi:hypothetical protein
MSACTAVQVQEATSQVGRADAPHFVAQIERHYTRATLVNFLEVLKKVRPTRTNLDQR